ncbi:hypothetical protein LL912_04855 [Niabella sp. CC-SYL272]|uniref:hypothetical protein n=1 Tax=Niabella agricola TaxID=2891571 RepID=UPI001F3EDA4F|nr:hypothetical protein [Niabella agricola]MCF3108098.1 hypothetical protein [Niabella agricola]
MSVQAVHHHHADIKDNTAAIQKGSLVKVVAEHCKVCDQIRHSSSPDLSTPDTELASPMPVTPVHGGRYYIGFFKFTLQGFTNKGPPTATVTV